MTLFRIVSVLFVILTFGCSPPGGKTSPPPISIPFPYQCSGPFMGKTLSDDDVWKVRVAHKRWLKDPQDPHGQQANFCRAEVSSGNFQNADLRSAVFQMAMLSGANFIGAQLNEAQFQGANLSGSNFSHAQLTRANMDSAMLHLATFHKTHFEENISFRDAMLFKTQLQEVDLTKSEGLTQSQMNMACLDPHTTLPKGLNRPRPCSERPQS
ncbi:MAG: pentapeptide repeat-containing protein [Nitrospirales bacterium]